MVSSKKIEVMCRLALGETLCATKCFPWQLKADNGHCSLFSKACCSLVWFKKTRTAHVEEAYLRQCVVLRGRWIQVTGAQHLLQSRLEMWRERLPPFLKGLWQLVFPPCLIFSHVSASPASITWQTTFPNRFLPWKLSTFAEATQVSKCHWFRFFFSIDDSFVCSHREFGSLRLLRFKGRMHLMHIMFLFHY